MLCNKKKMKAILATCILASTLIFSACGGQSDSSSGDASGQTESSDNKTYQLFPEFETVDLEGNTVSNEIFEEKDLTVVNVWGTYCSPCIDEMPELEAWNQEMPDNVQIIGLVCDVADPSDQDGIAFAQKIVETTGITYKNLLMNEDFEELTAKITGVPTTIFVSREGHMVQRMIVGADVDGYKETVARYLKLVAEDKSW